MQLETSLTEGVGGGVSESLSASSPPTTAEFLTKVVPEGASCSTASCKLMFDRSSAPVCSHFLKGLQDQ